MRLIKIQHPEIYPDGEWRWVANEREEGKVDDELVYYYLPNEIDLNELQIGKNIELDEDFNIMELEEMR
jgi:hypothetical protein